MTHEEHMWLIRCFFDQAVFLMARKTRDYNPENVFLLDVFWQAFRSNLASPDPILINVLLGKHLSALRHAALNREVYTESVRERTTDAVNYLAIYLLLYENRNEIVADIHRHVSSDEECQCARELHPPCERCRFLTWLETTQILNKDTRT